MDQMQRVAFIQSQVACMMAEAMGMTAENQFRASCGNAPAYVDADFFNLEGKYGLGHNAVITYLQG